MKKDNNEKVNRLGEKEKDKQRDEKKDNKRIKGRGTS
jgi:hypothetical protein